MSDHKHHEDHLEEVNGMKQGHGKVPKFLIVVYVVLAVWAVGYALLADGLDEREQATGGAAPVAISAEAGASVYGKSCAGCHGQNLEGSVGPALTGVVNKLGEDEVLNIIANGRGGMPPLGGTVSEDQRKSVVEFLKTKN
ncbi:cytochrome c [Microaerobacter geothermalis]|uniref:c-type cytochrome n=1 Tax=Microaerobacter geothermalis TaxID=674972 RepID=UPI001F2CAE06|nr:cytochrome c [Microaerobacter geothermalis]MCF6092686.1 cytochrome c [Microaerobacter geothermalis]